MGQAGFPYEHAAVGRASAYEFYPGCVLRTASAEDLIVTKAFADRDRDWSDIKLIIVRQRKQLDWDQILRDLIPLCELKEAPEIIERLKRLRDS